MLDQLEYDERVLLWQIEEAERQLETLAPFAHHADVQQQTRRLIRRRSRLLAALGKTQRLIDQWLDWQAQQPVQLDLF